MFRIVRCLFCISSQIILFPYVNYTQYNLTPRDLSVMFTHFPLHVLQGCEPKLTRLLQGVWGYAMLVILGFAIIKVRAGVVEYVPACTTVQYFLTNVCWQDVESTDTGDKQQLVQQMVHVSYTLYISILLCCTFQCMTSSSWVVDSVTKQSE